MSAERAAAAFAVVFVPVLLVHPVARARLRPGARWLAAGVLALVPLAAPLVLAARRPLATCLVAIYCGIVGIKIVSYFDRRGPGVGYARCLLFLTAWPALEVERVLAPLGEDRTGRVVRRVALGVVHVLPGLALLALGAAIGLPATSWTLDQLFKVFEVYALAVGANHLLIAAFAAAGFAVDDGFRYPALAHSLLDFWGRYNVWIHRWLRRHVYRRVGSRRPVAAVLAVFAVSGVLHEYLLDVAAPAVAGRQFAFFMLHGLGCVTGSRLGRAYRERYGRRVPRPLAIAATVAFVVVTAILFVSCIDPLFSVHGDVGAWLLARLSARRASPGG
jgi:hypothetical protein